MRTKARLETMVLPSARPLLQYNGTGTHPSQAESDCQSQLRKHGLVRNRMNSRNSMNSSEGGKCSYFVCEGCSPIPLLWALVISLIQPLELGALLCSFHLINNQLNKSSGTHNFISHCSLISHVTGPQFVLVIGAVVRPPLGHQQLEGWHRWRRQPPHSWAPDLGLCIDLAWRSE